MGSLNNLFTWLVTNSKKADGDFLSVFFRSLFIKLMYGKFIFAHKNAELRGIQNIFPGKTLHIGTVTHEVNHKNDLTKININGRLIIEGDFYHIGRGCRIDVAEGKTLQIGKDGFINPFTSIIVRNAVTIGDGTYISWNCQILDEDYHEVHYEGKIEKDKKIEIGNHVWIGTGVSIYQGTKIADGCVVAANAVVRGVFDQKNCIIGGNPAKVIKENISWK